MSEEAKNEASEGKRRGWVLKATHRDKTGQNKTQPLVGGGSHSLGKILLVRYD